MGALGLAAGVHGSTLNLAERQGLILMGLPVVGRQAVNRQNRQWGRGGYDRKSWAGRARARGLGSRPAPPGQLRLRSGRRRHGDSTIGRRVCHIHGGTAGAEAGDGEHGGTGRVWVKCSEWGTVRRRGAEVGSSGSRAPPGTQRLVSQTDSIAVRFRSHSGPAQRDGREAGQQGEGGAQGEVGVAQARMLGLQVCGWGDGREVQRE